MVVSTLELAPLRVLPCHRTYSMQCWRITTAVLLVRTLQIPYYGDGPKFVCGLEFLRNKTDCLVYSIGSNQEDGFERGVLKVAPNCEVIVVQHSHVLYVCSVSCDCKADHVSLLSLLLSCCASCLAKLALEH
jgi:Methyltransferase domain